MNLNKKIIAGLGLILMLGPILSFAHANQDELEEVKKTLSSLVQEIQTIPINQDKQRILQYFNKSYQSHAFSFGMNGKPSIKQINYAGLNDQIEKMVLSEGIFIKYEIIKILDGKIEDGKASLSFKIEYEIKEKTGIWVKGQEQVLMTFKKTEGNWMIVYRSSTGFLDETIRGACLCELFVSQSKDGEVVVKTTIPDGQNYSSQFDAFNFKESQTEEWIKVGQRYYTRDKLTDGKVLSMGKPNERRWIGLALNKKETILLLIKRELYPEKCATIVIKDEKE